MEANRHAPIPAFSASLQACSISTTSLFFLLIFAYELALTNTKGVGTFNSNGRWSRRSANIMTWIFRMSVLGCPFVNSLWVLLAYLIPLEWKWSRARMWRQALSLRGTIKSTVGFPLRWKHPEDPTATSVLRSPRTTCLFFDGKPFGHWRCTHLILFLILFEAYLASQIRR